MSGNGKSTGGSGGRTTLRIVAAVVERADGRHLLVRKRGTQAFMQVGGKIEPGEEPLAALLREFEEEVGVRAGCCHAGFLLWFNI